MVWNAVERSDVGDKHWAANPYHLECLSFRYVHRNIFSDYSYHWTIYDTPSSFQCIHLRNEWRELWRVCHTWLHRFRLACKKYPFAKVEISQTICLVHFQRIKIAGLNFILNFLQFSTVTENFPSTGKWTEVNFKL